MSSYSIALPLTINGQDGFTNIKDFAKLIRQNMKMLILTNPGERIMLPQFGLGLRKALFEIRSGNNIILNNMQAIGGNIEATVYYESRLKSLIKAYIPIVNLEFFEVKVLSDEENSGVASVIYSLPDISIYDSIIFIEKDGNFITERMPLEQAENIMRVPRNSNIQKVNLGQVTFDNGSALNYYNSER